MYVYSNKQTNTEFGSTISFIEHKDLFPVYSITFYNQHNFSIYNLF